MKITYFDLTLRKITVADKELIRYWRNQEKIKNRMQFRDFITKEMHNEWYEKMNNFKTSFAYIIEYKETSVGLAYNVNYGEFSDGGMFIWDETYLNSQIPAIAAIMLTDMNFYFLRQPKSFISILRNNYAAQNFNLHLGYKLVDPNDRNHNQRYVLTENDYSLHSIKIKSILKSYYNYTSRICIIFNEDDIKSGLFDFYKPHIERLGADNDKIYYEIENINT
jgi:hypothetical protein